MFRSYWTQFRSWNIVYVMAGIEQLSVIIDSLIYVSCRLVLLSSERPHKIIETPNKYEYKLFFKYVKIIKKIGSKSVVFKISIYKGPILAEPIKYK